MCFPVTCGGGISNPSWDISPSHIRFLNRTGTSDFLVTFGSPGTIAFNSDAPTNPPDCERSATCRATGNWVAISDPVRTAEPSSVALLMTGLFAGALLMWQRKSTPGPGVRSPP
jgi:hypothetical protein